MIPYRAQNPAAFRQSLARVSASPGVLATTALAAFTRPRRSLSLRSPARSSASRQSSGRPLVNSITVNRRVDFGISSSFSNEGNAARDSTSLRTPSRWRHVQSLSSSEILKA